jgi:cobalt-zinc-cadmium efflux system membrane fusion protein
VRGRKAHFAAFAAFAAFAFAVACSKKEAPPAAKSGPAPEPSAHAGEHADEPEHEGMPRRVRLAPDVVAAAKIRTAPIARQVLDEILALPGEIAADPDRLARVAPPVSGRIDRVDIREGTAVKRGDALATLRVPDFGRAKAEYAATQAKAAAAKANADRLAELATRGLAAQQEAASARAESDALDAQARASGELLKALGAAPGSNIGSQLVVRAPISGVVLARDAVVGQPVTTDETIATIADLSDVWFLARVFEKDLGRLRIGARVEVQLNAYPKETWPGTVEYVRQQIDPVARTLTARIRLKNRDDLLRIGLFGNAFVATGEKSGKAPALVVPRSAVTDIGDKSVVFVREADGDFELHDVTLGDGANGLVEVLSGLREGEQIVVDGVFTLKSVVLKKTIQEDEGEGQGEEETK